MVLTLEKYQKRSKVTRWSIKLVALTSEAIKARQKLKRNKKKKLRVAFSSQENVQFMENK